MKLVDKVLRFITKLEYGVMVVTFIAMVLAYFVSVVNRNFLKLSMPWTEEVAIYSMVYMALLGTEIGLRDGTQVAVTAVVDKLRGLTRKLVLFFGQLVLELFSFLMLSAGIELFRRQLQTGQTTPVLKAPMSAMYFSLVLAFGLVLLVQGVALVNRGMDLCKKEVTV